MPYQLITNLFRGISIFLRVIDYAILAYCLCSWILMPSSKVYTFLRNLVWPFVAPFKSISMKLMYKIGLRIDLSAWFALIALQIVDSLMWRFLYPFVLSLFA